MKSAPDITMKVLKWLDNYLEEVLMTLMLICISVVMIAQVISRYVFNASLSWSDELARYLLVWSCFLSVSYCVKRRISIKIEQLQNALPEKIIPWIKLFRHTLVFIFCIIMIPYAVTYLRQAIAGGATSAAMRIPMYYIQSAPLAGFILLAVRVAQAWVREFRCAVLGQQVAPAVPVSEPPADEFPSPDSPGEIWMETNVTTSEEHDARKALGTLREKEKASASPRNKKKKGGRRS